LLAIGGVFYMKLSIFVILFLCATSFLWQLVAFGAYRYAIAAVVASFCVPLATTIPGVVEGLLHSLAFGAAAIIVWSSRRGLQVSIPHGALWFMLLGALTIYFDWFTTPLVTLTIPLLALLWCNLVGKCVFAGPLTRNLLTLSAAWACGYVATWIGKWVLVAIFTHERDIFASVTWQILYRTGGSSIGASQAIAANLWEVRFGIIALVVLFVARQISLGLSGRLRFLLKRPSSDVIGATAILFAMPFLWMALIRQHSFVHSSIFVPAILYPSFAIAFGIGLSGISLKWPPLSGAKERVMAEVVHDPKFGSVRPRTS
jgi:hypothetical protein